VRQQPEEGRDETPGKSLFTSNSWGVPPAREPAGTGEREAQVNPPGPKRTEVGRRPTRRELPVTGSPRGLRLSRPAGPVGAAPGLCFGRASRQDDHPPTALQWWRATGGRKLQGFPGPKIKGCPDLLVLADSIGGGPVPNLGSLRHHTGLAWVLPTPDRQHSRGFRKRMGWAVGSGTPGYRSDSTTDFHVRSYRRGRRDTAESTKLQGKEKPCSGRALQSGPRANPKRSREGQAFLPWHEGTGFFHKPIRPTSGGLGLLLGHLNGGSTLDPAGPARRPWAFRCDGFHPTTTLFDTSHDDRRQRINSARAT